MVEPVQYEEVFLVLLVEVVPIGSDDHHPLGYRIHPRGVLLVVELHVLVLTISTMMLREVMLNPQFLQYPIGELPLQ